MPRRRRKERVPTGPYAELLALEAEAAAAAAGGDERAVALHRQVRSWLDMLAAAGGDREIAGLFAVFAAEGRSRIGEWWANPDPQPSREGLDCPHDREPAG